MKRFCLAFVAVVSLLAFGEDIPVKFKSAVLSFKENGVAKSYTAKVDNKLNIQVSGVGTIEFLPSKDSWGDGYGCSLSVVVGNTSVGIWGNSGQTTSGNHYIGNLVSLWDGVDVGRGIVTDVSVTWTIVPMPGTPTYSSLLYGSAGVPLYNSGNKLVYSSRPIKMSLKCEWTFSRSTPAPNAYINGTEVCHAHSTSHVIDYDINQYDTEWTLVDGKWRAEFSLGISGGASQTVTFKVTSTSDPAVSAQTYGGMGSTRRFEAMVDAQTRQETLNALD